MKRNLFVSIILLLLAFLILFLLPLSALATPSLGVATSTYNNQDATDQDYVDYYTTNDVLLWPQQSFIWDGTESLFIWVGMDNGYTGIVEQWEFTDVFLITNSAAGGGFSIDGGLTTFGSWTPGYQIDGYHRVGGETYYYTSLGAPLIDGDPILSNSSWSELKDPSFPGQWYQTSVVLDAPGFLPGDWLFAIADFDGVNGIFPLEENTITGGEFSPKTTSSSISTSTPIPEPATMLLLGGGLIGLAGAGRKKLFKKS